METSEDDHNPRLIAALFVALGVPQDAIVRRWPEQQQWLALVSAWASWTRKPQSARSDPSSIALGKCTPYDDPKELWEALASHGLIDSSWVAKEDWRFSLGIDCGHCGLSEFSMRACAHCQWRKEPSLNTAIAMAVHARNVATIDAALMGIDCELAVWRVVHERRLVVYDGFNWNTVSESTHLARKIVSDLGCALNIVDENDHGYFFMVSTVLPSELSVIAIPPSEASL